MRRPELKRIIAALWQLTPDQRKSVGVELAALNPQQWLAMAIGETG